jgi:hypothetical protein
MRGKIGFFLVMFLVVALTQVLWAQLPQTLDEMKQNVEGIVSEMKHGNLSGASQSFIALNNSIGSLKGYMNNESAAVRTESYEVLGVLLGNLQDALIANVSAWKNNERMHEFLSGELEKIGNITGPMLIAGLKDKDVKVQMNSVLAIGVLMGGRADFKALSFKDGPQEFQNMFSISSKTIEAFRGGFVLLSPEVTTGEFKAISDKVHEMIEAA